MKPIKVELEDGERQLVLLALAELSLSRPGFDFALNNIAVKMDNAMVGFESESRRGELYDAFRELNRDRITPIEGPPR
jgi:hypothetical protein